MSASKLPRVIITTFCLLSLVIPILASVNQLTSVQSTLKRPAPDDFDQASKPKRASTIIPPPLSTERTPLCGELSLVAFPNGFTHYIRKNMQAKIRKTRIRISYMPVFDTLNGMKKAFEDTITDYMNSII
ncbi:hypothetical protein BJ085DRAFT_30203 [Dimargaris cristalligena]|uniref:Uncharacterized protein n=1 Tax=Dimargaris cristalligena TaxID=215637 RepID=A0A4P9ZQB5_9FUNG|nr:hypothetical protein BJ085DRAFT_30203 [Dimargaris cristalligena]|eukprot:RKP34812.1 hypothetical protein BJ085DRAFT_30203 [Dimargaris cristalligena]